MSNHDKLNQRYAEFTIRQIKDLSKNFVHLSNDIFYQKSTGFFISNFILTYLAWAYPCLVIILAKPARLIICTYLLGPGQVKKVRLGKVSNLLSSSRNC